MGILFSSHGDVRYDHTDIVMLKNLWIPAALALCGYAAVLIIERQRPLRAPTQPKTPRVARNLTLGALGSATMRLGFYPSLIALSALVADRQWGLIFFQPLPDWARFAAGFLLLDYALYWWHRINHTVAFFWRFHNAHHVDLDLDISTGSRFHFGELIFSTAPRALEILVFGIAPLTMLVYDAVAMAAVHFHHSNMRLPERLDRVLALAIVTPRMHGIHHSIVRRETDSNFSTVFSFWDRLHGSIEMDVAQQEITIGVPSYRDPRELTFARVMALPFRRQRPWRMPDGSVPVRSVDKN